MKIYYKTRQEARNHKGSRGSVVDCKNQPSKNGSRWAVAFAK